MWGCPECIRLKHIFWVHQIPFRLENVKPILEGDIQQMLAKGYDTAVLRAVTAVLLDNDMRPPVVQDGDVFLSYSEALERYGVSDA